MKTLVELLENDVILFWHGGPGRGYLEVLDCSGSHLESVDLPKLSPQLASKALLKCENDETFDWIARISGMPDNERDEIRNLFRLMRQMSR